MTKEEFYKQLKNSKYNKNFKKATKKDKETIDKMIDLIVKTLK